MKKIAIPTIDNHLSSHFGECNRFAIYEINNNMIEKSEMKTPPKHDVGIYPNFLVKIGCSVVIAGGIGSQAQDILEKNNIEIIVGIDEEKITKLIKQYIEGKLESGTNFCGQKEIWSKSQ